MCATKAETTAIGSGPPFIGKLHDYFLHLRQAHRIVYHRDGLYGDRKGTRSVRCIYCLDKYPHKYNKDTRTIQECCFLVNRQSTRQRSKGPTTTILGRLLIDMLFYCREHIPSLSSYSLDAVSEKILNEKRFELLHHSHISSKYGSNSGRVALCEYCLQGAALPLKLLDKLNSLQTLWELSKLIGLPKQRLMDKRVINQKNVLSIISKYLSSSLLDRKSENRSGGNQRRQPRVWLIPSKTTMRNAYPGIEGDGGDSYEGGYVVAPKVGYYRETPILVGDFDSMYPSFIVAHNLCYSTFILPDYYEKHAERFVNVCNWVKGVNDRGTSFHSSSLIPPKIVYIQHPKMREWKFAIGVKSIIPQIEKSLMDTRGRIKTEIGTTSDRDKRVLRAKESVVKLIANSFYGVMGINFKGAIAPFTMLAQTITCLGKHYNKFVREYAHARGYKTIYGDTDSVMLLQIQQLPGTTTEQEETDDEYKRTKDIIVCLKKWANEQRQPAIVGSSTLTDLTSRQEIEKGGVEDNTKSRLVSSARWQGIRLMEDVSRSFLHPINVSYQNIFLPFLIEKKKHYIAGAYTDDPTLKGRQIVAKGLIRKDAFNLFSSLLQAVLEMIIEGTTSEQMTEFLSSQLSSCIVHSKVEDFVCTTELKKREHFATKERALSQPHTAVAWDLLEKTNGKRPKVGDSIEYVIVDPLCLMSESEIRNYLYRPEYFTKPKYMDRVSLRSYHPARVLETQQSTSPRSRRYEIDYCHYLNRICSGLEGIVWKSSRLTNVKSLCQQIKDTYRKNRIAQLQSMYDGGSSGNVRNMLL
ncbi:hypothetical protein GE061_007751 [Apolygus lucorum]|uniref:DNA polymerase n=1 Tax=Apolygus lucorum TaxID=248454 RepID=A0A8S9WQC2_APOLU|nr:hypothetical protein GE061_007751 [Apolygus lucorum]